MKHPHHPTELDPKDIFALGPMHVDSVFTTALVCLVTFRVLQIFWRRNQDVLVKALLYSSKSHSENAAKLKRSPVAMCVWVVEQTLLLAASNLCSKPSCGETIVELSSIGSLRGEWPCTQMWAPFSKIPPPQEHWGLWNVMENLMESCFCHQPNFDGTKTQTLDKIQVSSGFHLFLALEKWTPLNLALSGVNFPSRNCLGSTRNQFKTNLHISRITVFLLAFFLGAFLEDEKDPEIVPMKINVYDVTLTIEVTIYCCVWQEIIYAVVAFFFASQSSLTQL